MNLVSSVQIISKNYLEQLYNSENWQQFTPKTKKQFKDTFNDRPNVYRKESQACNNNTLSLYYQMKEEDSSNFSSKSKYSAELSSNKESSSDALIVDKSISYA